MVNITLYILGPKDNPKTFFLELNPHYLAVES